ncbi:MAG: hypothetical protein K2L12_03650, partial [Clostridia bacterium]|nr:hypothetical protein [Clostridia bacterium]
ADQTVYIIAGADSSGETYSFEFAFVVSVSGPEGTENDPYTVQEGVNSGSSTEYNSKVEAYIKYYTYTAETAGTITLTLTQGTNTTAAISNESYTAALKLKSGQYIYPGDADTCSLTVEADQTVYIIAGADSSGETYSFEFAFVAD